MANNDFEVIAYKILAYIDACQKTGVEPNAFKAQELAGCDEKYFNKVLLSLDDKELLHYTQFTDMNGDVMCINELALTLDGAVYLKENSRMQKVAKFLGKAFTGVLDVAVKASAFL